MDLKMELGQDESEEDHHTRLRSHSELVHHTFEEPRTAPPIRNSHDGNWQPDHSKSDLTGTSSTITASSSLQVIPLTLSNLRKSAHDLIDQIWRLQQQADLPGWRRDNEFLVANHRPVISSVRSCLASIFKIHSETLNIWTHLIAFIGLITYYPALVKMAESRVISRYEKMTLDLHSAMGMLCFFFSTAFHVLECHSPVVHAVFCRLDHFGIAGFIWASKLAWIKSSSLNRDEYLDSTLIFGANLVCIISAVLQVSGFFSLPAQRSFRTSWFISSTAVFVLVPLAELLLNHGLKIAMEVVRIDLFLASLACTLVGCVFYLCHIPERLFPGSCDVFLQGHTLMHILVALMAFLQVYGFHQSAINREHWKLTQ